MFLVEEIEKIATLARLELTGQEKETLARQFEEILNYFKIMEDAPAGNARAADFGPAGPLFREDVAVTSGVSPEDFSPHLENGHFKVPKVIE